MINPSNVLTLLIEFNDTSKSFCVDTPLYPTPTPSSLIKKKTMLKSNLRDIMQSDHCDEEDANAVLCVSYLNQTLRQKIFVIVYCCCLSLHQLDQIRKDIYNNNKERNLYIEPIRTISIVILT